MLPWCCELIRSPLPHVSIMRSCLSTDPTGPIHWVSEICQTMSYKPSLLFSWLSWVFFFVTVTEIWLTPLMNCEKRIYFRDTHHLSAHSSSQVILPFTKRTWWSPLILRAKWFCPAKTCGISILNTTQLGSRSLREVSQSWGLSRLCSWMSPQERQMRNELSCSLHSSAMWWTVFLPQGKYCIQRVILEAIYHI